MPGVATNTVPHASSTPFDVVCSVVLSAHKPDETSHHIVAWERAVGAYGMEPLIRAILGTVLASVAWVLLRVGKTLADWARRLE